MEFHLRCTAEVLFRAAQRSVRQALRVFSASGGERSPGRGLEAICSAFKWRKRLFSVARVVKEPLEGRSNRRSGFG